MSHPTRRALLGALTLTALASAAAAQPRTAPTVARPSLDAAAPEGFQIDARWELVPDASGVPIVLLHMVRRAPGVSDTNQCGIAMFVNNAWRIDAESSAFESDPADCLTAARVDNRWVIGRWTFGGYGDGPNAVNESAITLHALVNGTLTRVGSFGALRFDHLVGGDSLNLQTISMGREVLVWNPEHTQLVPRPTRRARPTAPHR